MTDERPISAWCRNYLESIESMVHDSFFTSLEEAPEVSNGHDSGDEDPNAWSDD